MTDLISRASDAKRLLEDPLLDEAFRTVEAHWVKAWRATGEAQERERERIWLMLKLLAQVRAAIEGVVVDGRMSEQNQQPKQGIV